MRKQMKRLAAIVLAASLTCMLPGQAVFAEDVVEEDTAEAIVNEEAAGDISNGDTVEDTIDEGIAETAETDEVVGVSGLSGAVFDDVNAGEWYEPYVSYVLNKGIMTGKGENLFAPAEELSRAQFATVLYRIAGSPDVSYSVVFPDVPDGAFFTKPALWASQEEVGVITGYDEGNFGPNDMITREQMATMLYRYAEYKGFEEIGATEPDGDSDTEPEEDIDSELDENSDTELKEDLDAELDENPDTGLGKATDSGLNEYPDAGMVSGFAKGAMEWAVSAGIITGDNGTLNPHGNTSRAVCATMIQRFCNQFMPDELEDVDMSAGCQKVGITHTSTEDGTFWIKAEGVWASMDIQKVQARVWCYDVNNDASWYTLEYQSDGSYGAEGSVMSHGTHFGTYYAEFYVMLNNGVRIFLDWADTQVDGSEAQIRVYNHVNTVYNEVGRDLYSCYMWVVNNVSYLRLPDPLEPPEGYNRAEWYAVHAFEQRQGNCYCYAAAFYFLAKGLGYDAEFIEGRVKLRSSGYNRHGWVIIHMDGASYICDPESTRDIGRYNFYMQPVSSPVMQYEW